MCIILMALALMIAGLGPARAAVVGSYTDRAAFEDAAARRGLSLRDITFDGLTGELDEVTVRAGRRLHISVFVTDGTLVARDGRLASEADRMELNIRLFGETFRGLGLDGGITDFGFGFLDGSLEVQVLGQGGLLLASTAAGPAFTGMLTSTPIRNVVISVESFDMSASAVAYATLDHLVLVTPVPAALPLAATGLLGLALLRRSRRR